MNYYFISYSMYRCKYNQLLSWNNIFFRLAKCIYWYTIIHTLFLLYIWSHYKLRENSDSPCLPLWMSIYLQRFSWLIVLRCSNLPRILIEFGVSGSPFAPHLSFGWLRAKNVVKPKSASPSSLISPNKQIE